MLKGTHYLLEAFNKLEVKNKELVLIGEIKGKGIINFMRKYKGTYKYLGKVPHNLLYKYYSNASVFVQPSVLEGLSMVIPEAMACGTPPIVTKNTGGDEVIKNTIKYFVQLFILNKIKNEFLNSGYRTILKG